MYGEHCLDYNDWRLSQVAMEDGKTVQETVEDSGCCRNSVDTSTTSAGQRNERIPTLSESSPLDPLSPSRVDVDMPCRRTLAFDADTVSADDTLGHHRPEEPSRPAEEPVNIRPSVARFTSFFVRDILANAESESDTPVGHHVTSCQPRLEETLPDGGRKERRRSGEEVFDGCRAGQCKWIYTILNLKTKQ